MIFIIIVPNVPHGSRVWVREGDGYSIPVLSSQGGLKESCRFYPKHVGALHKKDMNDKVFKENNYLQKRYDIVHNIQNTYFWYKQ